VWDGRPTSILRSTNTKAHGQTLYRVKGDRSYALLDLLLLLLGSLEGEKEAVELVMDDPDLLCL